jgi:hypothetical protein
MKTAITILSLVALLGCANPEIQAQGYLVQDGVVYSGSSAVLQGYEIGVCREPTKRVFTGFALIPKGKTEPTGYTNIFGCDAYVDVSVRVFLVGSNQPVSLTPILGGTYTELSFFADHVFADAQPFYVGLYTGADKWHPPDGVYEDPLFGWARLVNNRGVIELLDSALVYQAGGIYAGTLNIIPVPEPGSISLALVGLSLFLCQHRRFPFKSQVHQ